AFTDWPTVTGTSVTTSESGVPMAMFSVLVSTNPTAATVCEYGDAGGGEGGTVTSCLGCERTTEPMPNTSAANAINGRMNFFIALVSFYALSFFSTFFPLW